jgi:hypothetical protein
LKAAAEKAGLEVTTEADYKLGTPLGKGGTSPAIDEALYALKVGEVTKTPLKVGDTWVILGVTERHEADLAEFAKQREQLTQTMLTGKQSQLFEDQGLQRSDCRPGSERARGRAAVIPAANSHRGRINLGARASCPHS